MKIPGKITSAIFKLFPQHDETINYFCQRYIDQFNGENNHDIQKNGELFFLKKSLINTRVVFDVGANVGEWTKLVLNINYNLDIHCFEPSQATFQRLTANHFPVNVTCNPFGLGSSDEERLLYIFEDGSGNNSLYQRHGLEDGWGLAPQMDTETIRLMPLDQYCENKKIQSIDLLKVDVEGHELEVFKGATWLLDEQRIKMIQFEYGGCNIDSRTLLKDYFEFFEPYNFDLFKIYPKNLKFVKRYDQRMENFRNQNWVLINRNHKMVSENAGDYLQF